MRSLIWIAVVIIVIAAGILTYLGLGAKPLEVDYLTVTEHEKVAASQQELEPTARRKAERVTLPPAANLTGDAMAAGIERPHSAAEETEAALAELEELQREAMRLLKEMTRVYDTADRRIFVDSCVDIPESNESMQIIRGSIGTRTYFVPVIRPDAEEFFRVQDRMTMLSALPNVLHARALKAAGG